MPKPHDSDPLVVTIKAALDTSLEQLDQPIVHRLRHIRRQAIVDGLPPNRISAVFRYSLATAGIAAALVALVSVTTLRHTLAPTLPEDQAEELELLASQGSLDLYQNLDFYAWLAQTHHDRN